MTQINFICPKQANNEVKLKLSLLLTFKSALKSWLKKVILCCLVINISACTTISSNRTTTASQSNLPAKADTFIHYHAIHSSKYICQSPSSYADKVIGDGSCVSLIKICSQAPSTKRWSDGKKVMSLPQGSVEPGSVIATFKNGKYPSVTGYHAAIYISHDKSGIWVWDQWVGKAVHKRLIRFRHDNATASNTAQAYSLVN